MQSAKPLDKNIQFLISANYQRMMSFEQAAFLTNECSFKEFYLQKAEESEVNIQQLYLMLNVNQPADLQQVAVANLTAEIYLPNMLAGKKNTGKILATIQTVEKTIAQWYKNTLRDITDLPNEMVELVKEQYKSLNNAQVQLQHL